MFSQRIVILYSLKYLKWPDTFSLIARGSGDHEIIVIFFSSKHKGLGIIGKIIWFWSTSNREFTVNADVTRFLKLGDKNRNIKVIRLYSCKSLLRFLNFFFIKNAFYLGLWKGFFYWMIFLNSRFIKIQLHIYKTRSPNVLKNSNLKSILLICQKL